MAEVALALAAGGGLWLLAGPSLPAPLRLRGPQWWAAVAAAAGAAAGWLVTGWEAVGLFGGVLGLLAPRLLHARQAAANAAVRADALADAAAGLRDAVRAGHALPEALVVVAAHGPGLLRPEFALLVQDSRRQGIHAALAAFQARLDDPLADLLANILALNARLGGRHLAASLDALAAAIRAEAHTLREVRARQTDPRLSAAAVAAVTAGCLLTLRLLAPPSLLAAYDTPLGQVVLLTAGALTAAGIWLTQRLARPPAGLRLAAAPKAGRP